MSESDVERALRASLAENARHAPSGDDLAERIVEENLRGRPDRVRWRSWTLPLVAAASVAAVVGGVIAAAQLHGHGTHSARPPATGIATSTPTSAPTTAAPTAAASSPSRTGPTTSTSSAQPPATGTIPASFRILDLSFVGITTGFALGSGQCFLDRSRRCPAVLMTDDGGRRWGSIQNPPANVPINGSCAAPCVEHIRFVDPALGYAYGPDVFFRTSDGGRKWTRQKGGAISFEVANGTALRVLADGTVRFAHVGTDSWSEVSLPGSAGPADLLVRAADNAFVRTGGKPAHLYSSTDDGRTWTDRANPCASAVGSPAARIGDVAVGADGSVVLRCAAAGGKAFLLASRDAGASFGAPMPVPSASITMIGAADASTLFCVAGGLYRSTDGGRHWLRVVAESAAYAKYTGFLGFETPAEGRWVGDGGSTVWTTSDGGASWHPYAFS